MPLSTSPPPAEGQLSKIGILAGGGRIPIEIAHAARATGRDIHIVAIDPGVDGGIADFPHHRIGLGQVGRMLRILRSEGCRDLVIAGNLKRPDLFALRIDWGFVRHLPTILRLMRGGDDSVLRRVIRFFETQGFTVRGIAEVAPELLIRQGAMTALAPNAAQAADLALGYTLVQELGQYDIGQGVVVRDGAVLAVEAAEGTDAMLHRLSRLTGSGGVLVKAPKPGQELRIDLPTIGPRTIAGASRASLDLIALEAGRSVLADRDATLQAAEHEGIGIWGIPPAGDPGDRSRPAARPRPACVGRHAIPHGSRRDLALAHDVLLTLVGHGDDVGVVVSHEIVLAVAIREDPVEMVERAYDRLSWGRRRRNRLPGVVAVSNAAHATPGLLDVVARSRLSGVLVASRDGAAIAPSSVAAADSLNMFVAGVTT